MICPRRPVFFLFTFHRVGVGAAFWWRCLQMSEQPYTTLYYLIEKCTICFCRGGYSGQIVPMPDWPYIRYVSYEGCIKVVTNHCCCSTLKVQLVDPFTAGRSLRIVSVACVLAKVKSKTNNRQTASITRVSIDKKTSCFCWRKVDLLLYINSAAA